MISSPINDHACLGPTTEQIAGEVAAKNPAITDLAARFANTDDLAAWFRTLPQRDDEGIPSDGPKVPACRPPQRLRLDATDPNCFAIPSRRDASVGAHSPNFASGPRRGPPATQTDLTSKSSHCRRTLDLPKAARRTPTWPMTSSAAAWVRCTAHWALLLSPDSEDRCFAHFALHAHAVAGWRRDVDRLARRLLPPQSRQARDLAAVAANHRAIAEAYLIVGDDVKAREQIEALRQLASRQRKHGDAQFLLDQVAKGCTDHGLVTAEQRTALAPEDRVSCELALAHRA